MGSGRGDVGGLENHGVELDAVAHGNHDLGALVVVEEVMDRRAGAAVNGVRLGGVNQAGAAAGGVEREVIGVLGVGEAEFNGGEGLEIGGSIALGFDNQLAVPYSKS